MVVTIKIQLTINGKFYATGPMSSLQYYILCQNTICEEALWYSNYLQSNCEELAIAFNDIRSKDYNRLGFVLSLNYFHLILDFTGVKDVHTIRGWFIQISNSVF